MFVYNDQPTTFNSIIFPIKYKKKIVRGKKVCEECRKERRYRIILGGLVRYGWMRWQHCTACSEFVIALVSETRFLSSLFLSLSHPGNKRFEHFSDNDIQAFRANYPNTRFKNVLRSSPVIELPVLSSKLQNILHDQRA